MMVIRPMMGMKAMKVMKAMMVMRAMKGMKCSNQVARVRELGSTTMAAKRRVVNEPTQKAKPILPLCKICQTAKCQTMRAKLCRPCFLTNATSSGGRSSGNVITGTSKKRAAGLSSGNTLRGQKRVQGLALWTTLQKVIQANKGFVPRSVHDKMKMSAKAAMNKEIAEQKKVDERRTRLIKALAVCCPHAITH